jgi:hypothetical protein
MLFHWGLGDPVHNEEMASMKRFALLSAALLIGSMAFAQAQQPGGGTGGSPKAATVSYKIEADMKSIVNVDQKDTFTISVSDAQIETNLKMECQAGKSRFGGLAKRQRECTNSGLGVIVGPNGQKLSRAQYMGGYKVPADGNTDAGTLKINYLTLGAVPASNSAFDGYMNLKPELTPNNAKAMASRVFQNLNTKVTGGSGSLINDSVDTIELSRFFIPSAGMPSDKGCSWTGNMIYAYQTESWYLELTSICAGKEYHFKGNMPWTDDKSKPGNAVYDLTLTLPQAGQQADSALFA